MPIFVSRCVHTPYESVCLSVCVYEPVACQYDSRKIREKETKTIQRTSRTFCPVKKYILLDANMVTNFLIYGLCTLRTWKKAPDKKVRSATRK